MNVGRALPCVVAVLALLAGGCSGTEETTTGSPDGAVATDATGVTVVDAPVDSPDASPTANIDPGDASHRDAASDAGLQCDAAGRVPMLHHPTGTTWPSDRAAASPSLDASLCRWPADSGESSLCGCRTDSDCTAGQNGRCLNYRAGPGGATYCSYDECFQDSDCDAGQPCVGRASSSSSAANSCVPSGNCTVDSDCGPGGYCSPSNAGPATTADCACVTWMPCEVPDGSGVTDAYPPGQPPGAGCYESDGGPWIQVACACSNPYPCGKGYYCHTACDECTDDGDCGGGEACVFSLVDQRWKCVAQECPL